MDPKEDDMVYVLHHVVRGIVVHTSVSVPHHSLIILSIWAS